MEPIVSVIVPAYNSEKYILDCLNSISKQTLGDIEAVVVNSGSDDKTPDIVDEFCRHDIRFSLYNEAKRPPGLTRNIGMQNTKAPFMTFVDSDDTIDKDMLWVLHNEIVNKNDDIAVCDINIFYPDRETRFFSNLDRRTYQLSDSSLTSYYYKYCAAPKPNNSVCTRLYKREFLNHTGVRFGASSYGEDHLFNLKLLCNKPKIAHTGRSLYNYIQHEDSTTRKSAREKEHGKIFLEAFKDAQEYLEAKNAIYTKPILSIYSYTRIKSILFYAWHARLDDIRTKSAVESFLSDSSVKHYLTACINERFLEDYCQIHNYSENWTSLVHAMVDACLSGRELPDMKEIFQ